MRSTVQIVATFDEHNRSKENAVHEEVRELRDKLKRAGADDVTVQIATTTAQPQPNPLASLQGQGPRQAPPPSKNVDPEQVKPNGQYL